MVVSGGKRAMLFSRFYIAAFYKAAASRVP